MAVALTLIGTFAAIYHPVGIPMLVQQLGAARARRSASTGWPATSASRCRCARSPACWSSTSVGARRSSCRAAVSIALRLPVRALRRQGNRSRPRERTKQGAVPLPSAIAGARFHRDDRRGRRTPACSSTSRPTATARFLRRAAAGRHRPTPRRSARCWRRCTRLASFAQLVVGRLIDRVPLKRLLPDHRRCRRRRCSRSPRMAQGWCVLCGADPA